MPTTTLGMTYVTAGAAQKEVIVNEGLDTIDAVVGQEKAITFGAANYTLSTVDGPPHEWQHGTLILGGSPAADRDLIFPSGKDGMRWVVFNNTGYNITCKVSGQTGIVVADQEWRWLRANATDIEGIALAASVTGFEDAANAGTRTLGGGTYFWATTDEYRQSIDGTVIGRIVRLPAEAASKGLIFHVYNSGSNPDEYLFFENDAAGDIGHVYPGDGCVLWCDGTDWRIGHLPPTPQMQATNTVTMTVDAFIEGGDKQIHKLDPNAAFRQVELGQASTMQGKMWRIYNNGIDDELLEIENSTSTAIGMLPAKRWVLAFCEGSTEWSINNTYNPYYEYNTTALSADLVLTYEDKVTQRLDPNGANRNVDLPPIVALRTRNMNWRIFNYGTGNELLIVRDSTTAELTTIAPGQQAYFHCSDNEWMVLESSKTSTDVNTETLSAAKTLTLADARNQFLDCGASNRDCDLPPEASSSGREFRIFNNGASNNLAVRDDTPTTIVTLTPGQGALLVCDGTTWRNIGP